MTCPTAARIARGYEEDVVGVPRKYGMAEALGLAAVREAMDGARKQNTVRREVVALRASRPTLADLVGKATYIASPYTKYAHGHAAAAYDAAAITARLIRLGLSPMSPIVGSHHVADVGGLDKVDGELWQRVDAPWVRVAEACVVVMMPGWETSAGVQHEIGEFRRAGKPVVFMEWPDADGDAQADRRAA